MSKFEVNKETVRPFRIYDAKKQEFLPHRCYSDARRASIGALIQVRWADVGSVYEVLDVHKGRLFGQYKRGVNDITFLKGDL